MNYAWDVARAGRDDSKRNEKPLSAQLSGGVIKRLGVPAAGSLFPRRRGRFECELSIE